MNGKFIFHTKYEYKDRETKAKYVWLKYRPILKGKILDVGADECYLRQYLDNPASYLGIGLGGNPDQKVDLERESIPFPDNSFGCVLCLDVLEHLDNIHKVFDELCRVSRRYVVISLPNPWASFWSILRSGGYQPDQPMVLLQ
jgi:SAM-dependent methyltransferase